MNKLSNIFKKIFSIEIMTVLMLFMAFSCAVATFVENDYGPLGAKSFIYGQTWFESIMTILTIGVIANIIWFKMYQKKKFFIFMIHISLVFIFLGAALTRYAGYEGVMTIPENSMQNRILSNDEYIQVSLLKDKKEIEHVSNKVLMTPLNQTSFKIDLKKAPYPIELKFNHFVQNASEKIVDDKDGIAMINLIVKNFGGAKNIDLKNTQMKKTKFLDFYLNQGPIKSDKAAVFFTTKNNNIYIQSNIQINYTTKSGNLKEMIPANKKEKLSSSVIYTVGQTRFVTPEFTARGKIKTVSLNEDEVKKEDKINAVIVDVTYENNHKEVTLFGKGGSTQGYKRVVKLANGYELNLQWGAKIITLPFALLLDDFQLQRYPGSNSPSGYSSDVKLYDKDLEESIPFTISMNNTLDYKGFRFFQSSYKMDESATILSVNKDPGKVPTYIGYFLLFTGLILSLFSKNGRFQRLARKKYTIDKVKQSYLSKALMILFLCYTLGSSNHLFANDAFKNIDKTHAKKFGELLVQDYQGRIKPIDSLSIEIYNKVSRSTKLYDLNTNQLFLSMLIYPRDWQDLDIVKVSDKNVKKLLKIPSSQKRFAFNDVYNTNGDYAFQNDLEIANAKKPSQRNKFDKDLIKIDERLNIAYNVFSGAFLKFFPVIEDSNHKWVDPTAAIMSLKDQNKDLSKKQANEILNLMDNYFLTLKNASSNKDTWEKADIALDKIKQYQSKYGQNVIPNEFKIKAELLFNKINIFDRLTPVYLILGLLLLGAVFTSIFKPSIKIEKVSKYFLIFFIVAFTVHTLGLGLRWYVSGHAPWSNGYESMIYIAWAIILSGIIFSKQSVLALATTGVLGGITLFVAHLSWLEPQITTLTPVLKSYWLTIHVSVITASYGFLGLSAFLGFLTLIFFIIINKKKEDERFFSILTSIKEARRINEMSMMVGLVLLVIGNFLGGIWANESWGRYWGWDPKETWTLVSILIYAVILHLHYIKGLATNFIFACLSLVSYSAIIMTYFGVNYYLAGLHSYAAGDPLPIPTFVPISALIILITIAFAFRNRKVI